jgi:hypothetical protein
MKSNVVNVIIVIFMVSVLLSCSSMTVNRSSSQSWSMPENGKAGNRAVRTIQLAGVSVDRPGGWDSLEREVAALAPLYFWKHGFRLVGTDEPAAYAAFINLREREYASGWHTRRSLALEVRVWNRVEGAAEKSVEDLTGRLPIAAGRVVATGSRSFSSSGTTGKMLSRTINRTVGKLSAQGN